MTSASKLAQIATTGRARTAAAALASGYSPGSKTNYTMCVPLCTFRDHSTNIVGRSAGNSIQNQSGWH